MELPKTIIAITGSNGKTSTSEMIARILTCGALSVGWNREGSNQTEGVATLILGMSTLRGKVKCDALVIECDERYASKIFAQIKPSILLITNLCRDQMTRNGHPEFIQDCLCDAIIIAGEDVSLVLNADDPYIMAIAAQKGKPPVLFGIGTGVVPARQKPEMYDDGAYCPACKGRMEYKKRITAHFGLFNCKACGLTYQTPDIRISSFDYETGEAIINDEISLWPDGRDLGSLYNVAAAVAAATVAGIKPEIAAGRLDKYKLANGRTMKLITSLRNVRLLICKHENSLAYNNSLRNIIRQHRPCTVVIMVDSISRKYYTCETSWLWDVDFDILKNDSIMKIILTGRYTNELMMRFAMSRIDPSRYCAVENLSELHNRIENCGTEDVFVLTCFADKAKLLSALGVN